MYQLPSALLPSSETEVLSALVELKAGVGGSESSLFVAELLRMYGRFARLNSWVPTVLASSESDGGGFKDAILEVKGAGSYDMLRWESGVHRVQRVPATEASGRVHTSTVAAVVSGFELGV
jgi:peptide chain release factor 1